MFQKVHLRLTLLCTGITAIIMIIMSFCYLYVSETGLYRNQFQAFKNDMNTISTNLEQQTVISMEWLSKMEAQGNYLFFVLDNGTPFLFNQLNVPKDNSSRDVLLQESRDAYANQSDLEVSTRTGVFTTITHCEYEFTSSSTETKYYGSVIRMGSPDSTLEVIVLSSLQNLENQIREQRLRFLLIDVAAVLLLGIFSWFFTGRLLKPIVENQKKQALFIASASHELRTPLSVILSAAECCKSAPPERRDGFLKTICQEGLRVSSLVSDMLTLSQSDNQRFPVRMEPTELDTLLMNSYEAFQPLAQEKSISLSIELPEGALPACPADPERISQVISILIHNAISYTPEHGKITLAVSKHKERFHISVTDNGIGILEEDKKKIFDRFYRVEKSRSTKDHFGLGLSIAYEIVKAHGGNIQVSDALGGGSCFTVVL
ncbi:MAG: HAMP domain-containing histidine kinase [Lachnospiraceae bacterium]|nr:HAMP domain-containing histidine kinase [Lachnospiraceae bacterium]